MFMSVFVSNVLFLGNSNQIKRIELTSYSLIVWRLVHSYKVKSQFAIGYIIILIYSYIIYIIYYIYIIYSYILY